MADPAASSPPTPAPIITYRGEGTGPFQRLTWNAGRLLSRLFSILFFRLHVSGQTRVPPTGGILMVTNHQSFLDPVLIGIALSRQIHYMARDSLFKGGFLQYVMELWNTFPVKRGTADLSAIRAAVERLDKGFIVNVFPEGTRTEDGSIGPVAPGIALILTRAKTDVSVVPVVIDGAFEAWPRRAHFPRPRPIRLRYGRPIRPAEWRALSPEQLALRIRGDLVSLQEHLHSPHAVESRRRLEEDQAKAAANPAPTRSRRAKRG